MPPSGYSNEQSSLIIGFLKSCSIALEREGKEKQLSPTEALQSECANIRLILTSNKLLNPMERVVLDMTLNLYEHLRQISPTDYRSYAAMTDEFLQEVSASILGIHVPDLSIR